MDLRTYWITVKWTFSGKYWEFYVLYSSAIESKWSRFASLIISQPKMKSIESLFSKLYQTVKQWGKLISAENIPIIHRLHFIYFRVYFVIMYANMPCLLFAYVRVKLLARNSLRSCEMCQLLNLVYNCVNSP